MDELNDFLSPFRESGLEVKSYRHYNPATCAFDAAGCYEDLRVCFWSHEYHMTHDYLFAMGYHSESAGEVHDPLPCLCPQPNRCRPKGKRHTHWFRPIIYGAITLSSLQLEQWAEVSRICKEKNHFVVVDMAYQGFATGDLDSDAAGLRLLAKDGHKLMLCQSFAKNMGLYGKLS